MVKPVRELAKKPFVVEPGSPHPLGATVTADGINFSVFSEHATGIELLLFDGCDDIHPFQTVSFDPTINKTFHFWHALIRNAKAGIHYAIRVDGPNDPGAGHRFDREKVLIEPYSKGNNKTLWRRGDACLPDNNLATSLRSVVIDPSDYDWEGDQPLKRPLNETVVYELHVQWFTNCTLAVLPAHRALASSSLVPSRRSSKKYLISRNSALRQSSCCQFSSSTIPKPGISKVSG